MSTRIPIACHAAVPRPEPLLDGFNNLLVIAQLGVEAHIQRRLHHGARLLAGCCCHVRDEDDEQVGNEEQQRSCQGA